MIAKHPKRNPKSSWQALQKELEQLPKSKLKELVELCGIRFLGGTDSLMDRPHATVEEQLLLVLEEVSPQDIKLALKELSK
jgi:hypothetical protein